jgi:hypothetical protein
VSPAFWPGMVTGTGKEKGTGLRKINRLSLTDRGRGIQAHSPKPPRPSSHIPKVVLESGISPADPRPKDFRVLYH